MYFKDSREWMDVTNSWYQSQEWDFEIENNEHTIAQVMQALIDRLASSM